MDNPPRYPLKDLGLEQASSLSIEDLSVITAKTLKQQLGTRATYDMMRLVHDLSGPESSTSTQANGKDGVLCKLALEGINSLLADKYIASGTKCGELFLTRLGEEWLDSRDQ